MRYGASKLVVLCLAAWAGSATAAPPNAFLRWGEELYDRCVACHSLDRNRTGPRHCGLFGRRAGSVEGFDYSPAMENAGITWERDTLDAFLADPTGMVPGTFMGYAGIEDPDERAALIAWLEWAGRSAPACR